MNEHESIHVLMSRVMAEVQAIEKTQRNEHFNFNFRGIDDVMNHLHGPLTQHGVFFLPEVLESHVEHGTKQWHSTLRVRYTFFGPAGDSVQATVVAEGLDSSDKASTKAMSTALKYALLQVFCIPTEEQRQLDPDRSDETFASDWSAGSVVKTADPTASRPTHPETDAAPPTTASTGAESPGEPSASAPVAADLWDRIDQAVKAHLYRKQIVTLKASRLAMDAGVPIPKDGFEYDDVGKLRPDLLKALADDLDLDAKVPA